MKNPLRFITYGGRVFPVNAPKKTEQSPPTFKNFMMAQIEILKRAKIPEHEIPTYATDSIADGKKLRSYANAVLVGRVSVALAARRVKKDYKTYRNALKGKFNPGV